MPTLGDGLPEEQRREFLLNQLKPGCVVRLDVKFPDKTKPKFLVLVAEDDPEYWMFIVNSEINAFVLGRPHLLQCQVKVDPQSHTFLDYESFLACHDILKLRKEGVLQSLMQDMSGLKGVISQEVKNQVVSAVKLARTISKTDKLLLLRALDARGD